MEKIWIFEASGAGILSLEPKSPQKKIRALQNTYGGILKFESVVTISFFSSCQDDLKVEKKLAFVEALSYWKNRHDAFKLQKSV